MYPSLFEPWCSHSAMMPLLETVTLDFDLGTVTLECLDPDSCSAFFHSEHGRVRRYCVVFRPVSDAVCLAFHLSTNVLKSYYHSALGRLWISGRKCTLGKSRQSSIRSWHPWWYFPSENKRTKPTFLYTKQWWQVVIISYSFLILTIHDKKFLRNFVCPIRCYAD